MDPNDTRTQPAEAVIIGHIESYLGKVQEGWKPGGSNPEGGNITLVRYALEPNEDWVVLGSFGLSRLPLLQPTGKELRQEILVCWPEEEMTDSLLSHVYSVAQTIAVTGEALGRGALLPLPSEPALNSGSDEPYVAWCAGVPYFLPQSGVLCEQVDPPMLLTWLMPVYENEAEFITAQGIEAFEDLVLASRELMFSWPRKALV
ncbi:MAG: suppressor of fused domain protein [Alphaproteobacteria bacterium]|nr:suppressor of fused domain protein [Alphaproteobacteria bacterium]